MSAETIAATMTGRTYSAARLDAWQDKPYEAAKAGFGLRYKYNLTREAARKLVDHLAEVACDEADKGNDSAVDAIYGDIGKLMDTLDGVAPPKRQRHK